MTIPKSLLPWCVPVCACLFVCASVVAQTGPPAARGKPWPGSTTPLARAVAGATLIARAKAVDKAQIVARRHATYSASSGDGVEGGGWADFAERRQTFHVVEPLAGITRAKELTLTYTFAERSEGLPRLWDEEQPIPEEAAVILLRSPSGVLLKALPDTQSDRKAVADAVAAWSKSYLDRLVAAVEYDHRTSERERHWSIPKEGLKVSAATFEAHKADILRPIVPYLRNFQGMWYERIDASVWGLPVGDDPHQIGFHVSVWGILGGKANGAGGMGRPRKDHWHMGVFWDRKAGRVADTDFHGFTLEAVPPWALAKAQRIAEHSDELYKGRQVERYRWLPAWYVEQALAVPGEQRAKRLAEQYRAIGESTGHNLVMLHYLLLDQNSPLRAVPCRWVFVDLDCGRVVGVHKGTLDLGPRYDAPSADLPDRSVPGEDRGVTTLLPGRGFHARATGVRVPLRMTSPVSGGCWL